MSEDQPISGILFQDFLTAESVYRHPKATDRDGLLVDHENVFVYDQTFE